MTAPFVTASRIAASGRLWSRRRDRRVGLTAVIEDLVRCIGAPRPASLRGCLEDGLRRLLPARHVAIRDGCGGSASGASGSISLEIPAPSPGRRAVLELTVDPGCGLDDWDLQIVETISRLAALVLEIERARYDYPPEGAQAARRPVAPPLVGSSAVLCALRERIDRVAATDFTVLIEGESGSGKELVARQVHERSRRRRGPFVPVNCAALVETLLEVELFGIEERTATGVRGRKGKFEHAQGGTLFLDEVSDLSPAAQSKLLRAIQDLAVERVGGQGYQRIDTRLVVATNRTLGTLVSRGEFRADLFYRLSGIELRVPALREHREDIVELAAHFLDQHRLGHRLELSLPAADALVAYHWPGNVRELERVMERAVALARSHRIELDDLPPALTGRYTDVLMPSIARGDTLRDWASRYARLVLTRCGNNKREACRRLGISYHTLNAYLRYRPRPRLVRADAGAALTHQVRPLAGAAAREEA